MIHWWEGSSKMRIAITGGTGFLGKEVVRQLVKKGHQLLLLTRQNQEAIEGCEFLSGIDLTRGESFRDSLHKFAPEAVCHLGWEGIPDFSDSLCFKNLSMTTSLIHEAFKLGECQKFLGVGSCWEYGKTEGVCDESESGIVTNSFTWAKLSAREFGLLQAHQTQKSFGWFRVFFSYGMGQRAGSLIPTLIRSAQEGVVPEIKNPDAAQDFIFSEDVAEGIVLGLESEWPSGNYNLGTGTLTRVGEVTAQIQSLWKSGEVANFSENKACKGFWASHEKITRYTGWSAKTRLIDGLKKTLEKEKSL